MYSVYNKKHKNKKKDEYKEVIEKRIQYVNDRIKKEKEKELLFKYFQYELHNNKKTILTDECYIFSIRMERQKTSICRM